ncbi:hypothetical protein L915_08895, partial [Phytophthora nicotianae]
DNQRGVSIPTSHETATILTLVIPTPKCEEARASGSFLCTPRSAMETMGCGGCKVCYVDFFSVPTASPDPFLNSLHKTKATSLPTTYSLNNESLYDSHFRHHGQNCNSADSHYYNR